ncbi:MAG: hypothetical protein GWN29_11875, partial [Gammaproteobacteria bacterium]|nr:hypothetical protein [Gammaproteobacteria bacterium]
MREQVAVITAERDQLQNQLLALESFQTETIALPDDVPLEPEDPAPLPTIDDLMTDLSALSEDSVEEKSQIGRL